MRDHINIVSSAWTREARGIADRMLRKAVTEAAKEGNVEASQKYLSVDNKPILVTARLENAQVTITWTLDGTPLPIDEAVVAIATRMQHRLG